MAHQHGGGHGAHTARHGGDGFHHGLGLGKADVPAELAVIAHMDAHIHNGLALPQAVGSDEAALAHGHHDHISLFAEGGQVLGAGVADRDRSVFAVQHHGGRLAHHKASAHHHGPLAGEGNIVILQNFQAGLGGAGRVAQRRVGKHAGQRAVRDAVNVLFRGQCRADGAVIELPGQRAEEQTAVNGLVRVDFFNDFQQGVLSGIGGQQKLPDGCAHLAAAGHDAPLIGEVVLPLAHPDHGQGRSDAFGGQCRTAGGVCLVHGRHHGRAF